MTERDIHFELFLRKSPKGSWALFDAIPDRHKALNKAHDLIRLHPDGGVRVLKEQRNTSNSSYDAVVVAQVGNCDDQRKSSKTRRIDVSNSPCMAPSDLLTSEARKTIQLAMPEFLERNKVLPGELILRTDLLEQLEASGSEITQAIQRVAIERAGSEGLHAIVRQLHDLVSQAISTVLNEKRQGQHLKYDAPLSEIVKRARKKKVPKTALASAFVDRLKKQPNWPDKLGMLLEIWRDTDALENEADKSFCNSILSHLCSEWMAGQNTLTSIIGEYENLADMIDRLIAIVEPREKYATIYDPIAEFPLVVALSEAISNGVLPTAKSRIITQVVREIASPQRLFADSLQVELEFLRQFYLRLGKIMPENRRRELYDAVCARSNALMASDTVDSHLAEFELSERPSRLIELCSSLTGSEAKSRLSGYLKSILSLAQYEAAVLATKNPIAALSGLRATQTALLGSDLSETDRLARAREIDALGVRLIGESQITRLLLKKAGAPDKAALTLLRLAVEVSPKGECAKHISKTAMDLLEKAGKMGVKLNDPGLNQTLAQLAKAATEAGELRLAA